MAFANRLGGIIGRTALNGQGPMASMLNAVRYMSSSKLFVKGLSYQTDDQSLKDAFSGFGEVIAAKVISDRETGRSRGFGFVSYDTEDAASSAMSAMDGQALNGRKIRVSFPGLAITLRYPTLMFKGRITYSRTALEVDEAAKELIKFVEAKKKEDGRAILGFDLEWKPSFRKGVPPGKAAVMQICGDINRCYVMHIIHSGIPKSLWSLLEDDSSIKVGVCIANDGYKVFNDYNVSVKALEDLSSLANRKLGGDQKKWSLASLAEKVICKELPKPGNIRLGNWEADILSKEKLEYAATDAFASWYLYQALKNLPEDTGEN